MTEKTKDRTHWNRGKIKIASSIIFVFLIIIIILSTAPLGQKLFLTSTSSLIFFPEIFYSKSKIGFKYATHKMWIKLSITTFIAVSGIIIFGSSYRDNLVDSQLFLLFYSSFFPIIEFLIFKKNQ